MFIPEAKEEQIIFTLLIADLKFIILLYTIPNNTPINRDTFQNDLLLLKE